MIKKKNVRDVIISRVTDVLNDESLKFSKKQIIGILEALEPKQGGSAQTKIDDDGMVYCNYYKEYLSPDNFKLTPNGKYPPMSIDGTKMRQKSLTLDKQMNKEISEAFLSGKTIIKEDLIKKYDALKSEITLDV